MTGLPSFNLTAAIEKIAEPVWNDFAAHLRTASPNEVVIAVMVEKRECVEDLGAILAIEQHVQFVHPGQQRRSPLVTWRTGPLVR